MHHYDSIWADPRTWVGIAFLVFFLIFGKRIVTIVLQTLDRRGIAVQQELDEASRLRQEAEAMLAAANAQREAALRDAKALLDNAHAEAARLAEAARAEAEAAAARRERMAIDRIAAAEKAAVTDVRIAAAEVAGRAAQTVLVSTFDDDADTALIDRAIQGLPAALASRRAA